MGMPHYLPKLALDQVVSVNATAGGNASLIAMGNEGV
jgi:hypothetical protein